MPNSDLTRISSALLANNAQQFRHALSLLSEDQVAEVKLKALSSPYLSEADLNMVMYLIQEEREIRRHEGLGRKAKRFWANHGDGVTKAGLVGVGALFGIYIS